MEYVQYIISLALSIYVLSSSEADDYLNLSNWHTYLGRYMIHVMQYTAHNDDGDDDQSNNQ